MPPGKHARKNLTEEVQKGCEKTDAKKRGKRERGKWVFFLRYSNRNHPLGDLNRLAALRIYGVYDVGVLSSRL